MELKIKNYDAIILGGGPAGISCALELHEARVNYLLIDRCPRLGGQLPQINNTLRNFAARFYENGHILQDDMEQLCKKIGIFCELSETISTADLQNKILTGLRSIYKSKTIFLATGVRWRQLSFKGQDSVAQSIINEIEDNGALLVNKSVVVIGGGDNALMDCLWLAQRCSSVLLVLRSDQFKARPDVVRGVLSNGNIKVQRNSEIVSAVGEFGKLQSIQIENKLTQKTTIHPADYLVIKIGFTPNSELFTGQLEMDKANYIVIDPSCCASIEGIFAGGDLAAPELLRIAKSVGNGIVAARSISNYLK